VVATPNGGSFAKRTGLRRHMRGNSEIEGQDVDLPFVVKPSTKDGERIDDLLRRFEGYAAASYPSTPTGPTASSVEMRLVASKLNYDLVPMAVAQYPDYQIILKKNGTRRVTSVEKHIEFIHKRISSSEQLPSRVRFNDCVRLMIAVRFSGDIRFLALASPTYLSQHKAPRVPEDLKHHRCIRNRLPSGKLYRWEFEKRGQEVAVDVPGTLTLDHIGLMTEAAVDGLGIVYVPERSARPNLNDERLVMVLSDWCPSIPGLFLYYPGRRHMPAGLRAFIEVLREAIP